jgi:hypothetical protein
MSETKKVQIFNINPLVIEVEDVIKKGLHKILGDYMDRYELLENTHKQIMRLPSIRHELNKQECLYSDDEPYHQHERDEPSYISDKLDHRLRELEKKYDSIAPVLDKILNKMSSLDEEVKSIKSQHISSIQNTSLSITPIKENKCENIQIKFEEPTQKTVEEEKMDQPPNEVYEKVVEDEFYEEEDEDVNPILITCDNVSLNKEEDCLIQDNVQEHEVVEVVEEEEELVEEAQEELVEEAQEELVEEAEEELVEEAQEELVEEAEEELVEEAEEEAEEELVEEAEEEAEDEASIETETKSDVEEEEAEHEEIEPESEPPKAVVEESKSSEQDDDDLFEIEIDDKTYCTNNDQTGFIWELTEEGEQGEKIGYFEGGDAYFYEDEDEN